MSIKRQKRKLDSKSKDIQRIVAKKLNKFCKYLDSEYNINSGGCCFVAYLIARLLNRDGFKFKLVVWDGYFDDSNEFKKLYTNHNHYGILLNGCFINEAGYHNNVYYDEVVFSNVKVTDILNHYKASSWNSRYNKYQNSYISRMIEMFYNDLTENLREE